MSHDVFISYSYVAADKAAAEQVCRHLESQGFSCWIAPRDVLEGDDFAAAITSAIHDCRVLILIFSLAATASRQIARELKLADDERKAILPIRIENVSPSGTLAYFLGPAHWLDAIGGIQSEHLQRLTLGLRRRFLSSQEAIAAGAGERPQTTGAEAVDFIPGGVASTTLTTAHAHDHAIRWDRAKNRYLIIIVAVVVLGAIAWWQIGERSRRLSLKSDKAVLQASPVKLNAQNFHCENASCENRSICSVTRSWTLPDPSCHVLRVDLAKGPSMQNSSTVQLSISGSNVTAFGSLDTASCIKTTAGPAKLLHMTIYDMNATPVVVCPEK